MSEREAGKELDAEIARAVFGRSIRTFEDIYGRTTLDDAHDYRQNVGQGEQQHWTLVPPYSADIAAAWLVVERLREMSHPIVLTDLGPAWAMPYLVQIQGPPHTVAERTASMPLSICLAALAAIEGAR